MLMLRIVRRSPIEKVEWRTLLRLPESNQNNCACRTHVCLPSTTVRYYANQQCPPKKPPPKQGGGAGKTIFTLGALTLVAGGATLAYAHYDPEFRKTLTGTVPFTDTLITAIFEDGGGISGLYGNLKSSVIGAIAGGERKHGKVQDHIPEPKEYKAPPPIVPAIEKEAKKEKTEESYSEVRVTKKGHDEAVVADDCKPKSQSKDSADLNLADLEKKICASAEEAVNAYNKAIHILKQYNQDIEYIIDEAVNQVKQDTWDEIRQKTRSKIECIRRAQVKADEATRDVNRLKEIISSPTFNAPDTTKDLIRNNIAKVQEDIEKAKKELEIELKQGSVTEKYWDKVEKARKHFSEELEILFPEVDISKKQMKVAEEELDLFILHAYAHVLFYQKELAKMETMLQNRIQIATDQARKGGLEPLSVAQICEAVEQEKRRLTLCFQQQLLKLRKDCEAQLREQLKLQSQTFNDHLNDAVKTRELEMERLLARKFDEQLEEERCRFKLQLGAMVGRLRGLDEAIKARNDADASSKQAQVLWSACQALLRSIKAGCPGLPWKDQIRPLDPEISAVKKAAAPNDELVQAVISGIPREAKDRGVYPEDALRERFLKVEKVARTVALIPETGAALPVHILSYIQSLLLIKAASPIPSAELNDEKIDFKNLNTNDILQRARYWLDRGDFAQALKYMNLLKGAPRCVARQWMNETRILLETQQAANTLMAHAAANGLMYL